MVADLNKKEIEKWTNYWLISSKEKLKTMSSLYKGKRYSDPLFFGHLILEKIFKALTIIKTREIAPRTHDLLYLANLAKINLSSEEKIFLETVNKFNISTRYPDEKLNFYQKCDRTFTDKYYNRIIEFYKSLCKKIK